MKRTIIELAMLFLVTAGGAFAAQTQSTMAVSATVIADCSISTVDNLAFGNLDHTLATSNFDQQANIHFQCTNGTAVVVQLDAGLQPSGAQRRMISGTNYVSYNLYQDNGRTTAWGNTVGTELSLTANGNQQTQTVFGRVPATGYPLPATGTYGDTVTVTFDF